MFKSQTLVTNWPALNVTGRKSMRHWYRINRRCGMDRHQAKQAVAGMIHGALMGDFWVGQP